MWLYIICSSTRNLNMTSLYGGTGRAYQSSNNVGIGLRDNEESEVYRQARKEVR